MLTTPTVLILILFTFAATLFHVLLSIERPVWRIALRRGDTAEVQATELRFVHQSLKRLIPILPPSNGVAVIGGFSALIWQGALRDWDRVSVIILAFYLAGQLYIILFGKILSAIRDVWTTSSDGDLNAVRCGVRNLIRQHFNGLLHALGVLVLELSLVIF
jgi:hypothetical protein